ncbi:hypothetical protein, partial [Salmonella enterica]|uniref:hypothetical protein n=1 Tax=Salmonella enterica TaxID=28901 RepID=UPI003297A380
PMSLPEASPLAGLRERVDHVESIRRGGLTVAIVQLDNGYWLVGRAIAADDYDADSGAELAFEDALRQALPLLAFARLDRDTDCACAQAPC